VTGGSLQRLRRKLEIDPFALAALLGVHVSTVYRWEVTYGVLRIDPLQASILDEIRGHIDKVDDNGQRLGRVIKQGLIKGGGLRALLDVLEIVL
jgi:hypothetical protein